MVFKQVIMCLLLGVLYSATAVIVEKSHDYAPLATITQQIYFDIQVDDRMLGRIVFGMYGDVVPKTVENFVALAKGDHGRGKVSGKPLSFVGSPFHRIIPNFMAQGGDITNGNGRGGESIYGRHFPDENFDLSFTRPYLLAMANAGPDTNGSQFFITFAETSWLNGKHVIFGEVLGGKDVVDWLEGVGTKNGNPTKNAIVVGCGVLEQ